MQLFVSQILNGIGLGMIYFLVAVGLTLIFGVMRFVNFAHGVFYLLGAYGVLTLSEQGVGFVVAILLSVVAVMAFAGVLERVVLSRVYDLPPFFHILSTFGITLMVEEAVRMIWTAAPHRVLIPPVVRGLTTFGPFFYPNYRIVVIAVAAVCAICLWLFLERTRYGATIRAGSEHREVVRLLGIDIARLFSFNFVLGAGLAALAGALVSPIRGVDPNMGLEALAIAFVICVVGGLGSFRGALVGALLIGILQSLATSVWGSGAGLVAYLAMAAVLLVRPQGLFPGPGGSAR
ncbi:branched-chain amino acid ABC transporter permease [Bradyrhizobium sp.]|uniref:branched-chain amino acid ABC transporter permease n=1 Tax=Bradyrhizobium sp. TaxID=376 RepID=UPI0039E5006B